MHVHRGAAHARRKFPGARSQHTHHRGGGPPDISRARVRRLSHGRDRRSLCSRRMAPPRSEPHRAPLGYSPSPPPRKRTLALRWHAPAAPSLRHRAPLLRAPLLRAPSPPSCARLAQVLARRLASGALIVHRLSAPSLCVQSADETATATGCCACAAVCLTRMDGRADAHPTRTRSQGCGARYSASREWCRGRE